MFERLYDINYLDFVYRCEIADIEDIPADGRNHHECRVSNGNYTTNRFQSRNAGTPTFASERPHYEDK